MDLDLTDLDLPGPRLNWSGLYFTWVQWGKNKPNQKPTRPRQSWHLSLITLPHNKSHGYSVPEPEPSLFCQNIWIHPANETQFKFTLTVKRKHSRYSNPPVLPQFAIKKKKNQEIKILLNKDLSFISLYSHALCSLLIVQRVKQMVKAMFKIIHPWKSCTLPWDCSQDKLPSFLEEVNSNELSSALKDGWSSKSACYTIMRHQQWNFVIIVKIIYLFWECVCECLYT